MSKVKELPTFSKETLRQHRDYWIGVATSPLNEDRVKELVYDLYDYMEKPRPENILFVDCPLDMITLARFLKVKRFVEGRQEDSPILHDFIDRFVYNFVKDQVVDPPRVPSGEFVCTTQMTDFIYNETWRVVANRTDSVLSGIASLLEDAPTEPLADVLNFGRSYFKDQSLAIIEPKHRTEANNIIGESWTPFIDQTDYWTRFSIALDVLQVAKNPAEKLLLQWAREVGWFMPFEKTAIISHRPVVIKVNARGELHSVDGTPAIQYRNGGERNNVYASRGIILPKHIGSTPASKWKGSWVFEAKSADMRAMLVDTMGPERFISEIGGNIIDKFTSDVNHSVEGTKRQIVELYEPDWSKFKPNNRFKVLHLTCPSTRLHHWHWVPPEHKTAREAYTWFWNGREPETMSIEA